MGKVIDLMVNRHMIQIPVSSIIYANVTDKLCKIYLDNGESLNLFITITNLMDKLGEEDFLRVSRSSLISYASVEQVNQEEVILSGGTRIPYSRSRRKEIMEKAKNCIQRQVVHRDRRRALGTIAFQKEFAFWDDVPLGFCVLEFVENSDGQVTDFMFRYVNHALGGIEGVSRENLLNHTYGQVFKGANNKWLGIFSKVAFWGDKVELIDYSPVLDKELLLICYQPVYGYCACIVCDATDKYYLQMKR